MKSNIFYVLLIMASSFIACNKTIPFAYDHWGEASASKNGNHWESYPRASIDEDNGKLFIQGNTYSPEGFHREELIFIKVPMEVGIYNLSLTTTTEEDDKVGAWFYTSIDDGDVTGDIYKLSPDDSTNNISITQVDGDEIWGNFNVILYKDTIFTNTYPIVPDTLVFTNGQFHTRILGSF